MEKIPVQESTGSTVHPLLSDAEIQELTGTKIKKKQREVLRENGIAFVTRADGKPRTTWYNVNHPAYLRQPSEIEPDFGAIQ